MTLEPRMRLAVLDLRIVAGEDRKERTALDLDVLPPMEVVENADCGAESGNRNGSQISWEIVALPAACHVARVMIENHAEMPPIREHQVARLKYQRAGASAASRGRRDADDAVAERACRDHDLRARGYRIDRFKTEKVTGPSVRGVDRVEHLDGDDRAAVQTNPVDADGSSRRRCERERECERACDDCNEVPGHRITFKNRRVPFLERYAASTYFK